jgi:hypothetical protein
MLKIHFALFLLLASVIACSTPEPKTTVIPREAGDYVIVATARSETKALETAVADGGKYCSEKGKSFVVSDPPSEMNKEAKGAVGMATTVIKTVMKKSGKIEQPITVPYLRDGDQLVMNFKCKDVSAAK